MYEYKFEKVELKGAFRSKPVDGYEDMVNRHAREGWRLIQILAPPTVGYGAAGYYEFVFERKRG